MNVFYIDTAQVKKFLFLWLAICAVYFNLSVAIGLWASVKYLLIVYHLWASLKLHIFFFFLFYLKKSKHLYSVKGIRKMGALGS